VGFLVATDDGIKGFKGFVTDLLANVFANAGKAQAVTVYACGPKPMLKSKTGLVAADLRSFCRVFPGSAYGLRDWGLFRMCGRD